MTLCAFSIQNGLNQTAIVLPVNLTNPVLQSSWASRRPGTCARQDRLSDLLRYQQKETTCYENEYQET
jgi:hypothetical protein